MKSPHVMSFCDNKSKFLHGGHRSKYYDLTMIKNFSMKSPHVMNFFCDNKSKFLPGDINLNMI
jgi:hypothetical protein